MILQEPAEKYIPHEDSMLFINNIIEFFEDVGGTVEAELRPDCIFADSSGKVDLTLYLELMAQSFAALEGYSTSIKNKPAQKGFLVGVQQFNVLDDQLRVGMPLVIRAQVLTRVDDFAIIDCSVSHVTKLMATATIKLYIPGMSE